ncbi:hypothetical protein PG301_04530 [Parageobacillus sp. G301]|jgi:dipeptidase E|nr:hypothetical protein PG301_04530 [Parageobacillus sp. G301]
MRQIIALGGGGFSMEPDNPLLDLYILKQAKKTTPKVCFIPTARGFRSLYIKVL